MDLLLTAFVLALFATVFHIAERPVLVGSALTGLGLTLIHLFLEALPG